MNSIDNTKILVIGGAGFIGSHLVKELLKEDIKEVIIYDNFVRGKMENIEESLKDSRCYVYPLDGDIRDTDILDKAMKGVDYVFHLAAIVGDPACEKQPTIAKEKTWRQQRKFIRQQTKMDVKNLCLPQHVAIIEKYKYVK